MISHAGHQDLLLGLPRWGVTAAVLMWFGAPFLSRTLPMTNWRQPLLSSTSIVPLSIGFMGMLTVANHGFNSGALALSVARLVLIYLPLALIASYFAIWESSQPSPWCIAGLAAATWFRRATTLAKH